jgi:hypothetical protein
LNEIRTIVKGVVLKYEDVKNGIFDTEYDLSGKYKNDGTIQESTQQQPISLIDLDDDIPINNQTPPQSSYNDLNTIFNEDSNTNSDNPFDLLSQSLKTTSLSNQTQHFSPPNTSQSNHTQHVPVPSLSQSKWSGC